MENLKNYLAIGNFELFVSGIRASFRLGEKSSSLDNFLKIKNAENFVFISFDDYQKVGTINNADEERAYMVLQEETGMSLIMKAGSEGWQYYLAGFRPDNNWASIGGVIVVNNSEENIKKTVRSAGYNWVVRGKFGGEPTLIFL